MNEIDRLEWFPCEPEKLLGALAGMPSPKQLVYLILLLRIYENGGACPDGVAAIALRTRLNKRVVSEALDELFREGRLYRGEDGIRNKKADVVISESWALLKKRKEAGSKGGSRTAQKTKKNQQNEASKATATPEHSSRQRQGHIQESLFTDVNRPPEPAAPVKSEVMPDPPLDPEADYYRRGREVLGKNAGGMLTQLLKFRGGNLALARANIEMASTRGDAREYVGAMIRNRGGNDETNRNGGPGRGGFSTIAAKIRRGIEDREAFDGAPADSQPAHGR